MKLKSRHELIVHFSSVTRRHVAQLLDDLRACAQAFRCGVGFARGRPIGRLDPVSGPHFHRSHRGRGTAEYRIPRSFWWCLGEQHARRLEPGAAGSDGVDG
jgi:hypothetical protein